MPKGFQRNIRAGISVWKKRCWFRALQGVFLGLGFPLGWLGLQAFQGSEADGGAHRPAGAVSVLVGASLDLGAFGLVLGCLEARLEEFKLIDSATEPLNEP